jgi:hypothetical protein
MFTIPDSGLRATQTHRTVSHRQGKKNRKKTNHHRKKSEKKIFFFSLSLSSRVGFGTARRRTTPPIRRVRCRRGARTEPTMTTRKTKERKKKDKKKGFFSLALARSQRCLFACASQRANGVGTEQENKDKSNFDDAVKFVVVS